MRNLKVLANCCTVLMILFILFSFLTKDVIHSNISAFLAIILGVFIFWRKSLGEPVALLAACFLGFSFLLNIETHTTSLSQSKIPKVATPRYSSWGDILRWSLQENFPG